MGSTTAPERDLQPSNLGAWDHLAVPDGWTAVADLCRTMLEQVPTIAEQITDEIVREVPGYPEMGVPRDDLALSVRRNAEDLLLGIAERREPTPEEIQRRADLGVRRATQGLPVDRLMQAFHVGYRELWQHLLALADDTDADLSAKLLQASTTMWVWTHTITDALGHSHAETLRSQALHAASLRQRFLQLVLAGDRGSEEAVTLARTLDFDTSAPFRAHVARTAILEGAEAPRVQAGLRQLPGTQQVVPQGTRLVVLAQGRDGKATTNVLLQQLPEATIGTGLWRSGLDGARLSVGDAERAVLLTDPSRAVDFEQAWPWALLAGDIDRVAPLLDTAVRTAADHPHLAEAVIAYAEGGSIADAGRRLDVHPNTITYRLERWAELSGWDARTFNGLLRSVIALRIPR